MASDDFGSFLTYLPTQIRSHQMEPDLPTYPNIWRQIFQPQFVTIYCIVYKCSIYLFLSFIHVIGNLNQLTYFEKNKSCNKLYQCRISKIQELCVSVQTRKKGFKRKKSQEKAKERSDVRSSVTYPPTPIRLHQMTLDLPTYPKIWCHMWMAP